MWHARVRENNAKVYIYKRWSDKVRK
jgi:hypothetical protein